jgi:Rho termination factor, N-terminal domain
VPTSTQRDTDPQNALLSTVRESQAAVIDVLRAWTDITQQLTRNLRLPVAAIDVAGVVDRAFDVAEQSLAVQRQVARTLVGAVTRQAETAVETVDKAVDTTVETVAATVSESADRFEGELEATRERAAQAVERAEALRKETPKAETPKAETPKAEAPKAESDKDKRQQPGRRTYEERSIEELRERARELDIEGRSSMSKDELIAALRKRSR